MLYELDHCTALGLLLIVQQHPPHVLFTFHKTKYDRPFATDTSQQLLGLHTTLNCWPWQSMIDSAVTSHHPFLLLMFIAHY